MTITVPVPPVGPSDEQTRLYVALILITLFATLTLAAPSSPAAAAILKEVLVPLITGMLGYLFGQRQRSS